MAEPKPFNASRMDIIDIDEANTLAFDASRYLDDDETISAYLTASLLESDPDAFLQALAQVAKSRGMTQVARDTGLSRESLYKALQEGAKPRYDTILKVVVALNLRLSISPEPSKDASLDQKR